MRYGVDLTRCACTDGRVPLSDTSDAVRWWVGGATCTPTARNLRLFSPSPLYILRAAGRAMSCESQQGLHAKAPRFAPFSCVCAPPSVPLWGICTHNAQTVLVARHVCVCVPVVLVDRCTRLRASGCACFSVGCSVPDRYGLWLFVWSSSSTPAPPPPPPAVHTCVALLNSNSGNCASACGFAMLAKFVLCLHTWLTRLLSLASNQPSQLPAGPVPTCAPASCLLRPHASCARLVWPGLCSTAGCPR